MYHLLLSEDHRFLIVSFVSHFQAMPVTHSELDSSFYTAVIAVLMSYVSIDLPQNYYVNSLSIVQSILLTTWK